VFFPKLGKKLLQLQSSKKEILKNKTDHRPMNCIALSKVLEKWYVNKSLPTWKHKVSSQTTNMASEQEDQQ
jgi:hypothetical protein